MKLTLCAISTKGAAMPKAIRANSKISERKAAGIVAELDRWREGELGIKLTWERVEAFSGFTRQALRRHPDILRAYPQTKHALPAPDRRSRSRSQSDELTYLAQTVPGSRTPIRRI